MLPDEDGLTILKSWERRETRKIPVIMVTAKTTELDKVKGLDNGADDYMTKPFWCDGACFLCEGTASPCGRSDSGENYADRGFGD